MAAAVHLSGDIDVRILAANVKNANALGRVELVRGEGEQVDSIALDVDRNFADCLRSIDVEEHAALLGELADFGDGLNHPNFVVGVHDGDEDRFGREGELQIIELDAPVARDRQVSDFAAGLFEMLADVEHGLVLGDLGDYVAALLTIGLGDAFQRQIDRFGRAAGEDNFARIRADQAGDLRASGFDGLFGFPPKFVVAAGGVAELFPK